MYGHAVDDELAGTVVLEDGSTMWPPIPSVDVEFKLNPYVIGQDRIIKLEQ